MNGILKTFKNRNAPGSDEINMELFKYASITAKLRFLSMCWATCQIPDDWRKAEKSQFTKKKKKNKIVGETVTHY
jgi:hypothetical protein